MEGSWRLPLDWRQKVALGIAALGLILVELTLPALPVGARGGAQTAAAITETRLRSEPSRRASALLRLPEGATVTVHGKPKEGWYEASSGRLKGFVLSGDVATFPVAAVSELPTPAATEQQGVVSLEQKAHRKSGKRRKHDDRSSGNRQEIVAAAELNLRHSPSLDAPIATVMPRGALIHLLGNQKDG